MHQLAIRALWISNKY